MSFFKSIKNAFGSDGDDYDVYGQPTSFVNPFSKDKNVAENEHKQQHQEGEVHIEVDKHEEYTIDAEFADKAARLMNEHTQAVIDMLKGSWKQEREDLMKKVEEAKKMVDESKEKMQANEANRKQAQTRANDLTTKLTELEAAHEKLDIEKKSLESRLRAMEAQGDNTEELNGKIQELNGVVEDLKAQLAERDAEIERRDAIARQAEDGPSIEELNEQIQQRDELIQTLRANVAEVEEGLNAANEELKGAEELQKTVEQVEEFKEKKNSEIASLRQQVADLLRVSSEYDELRKKYIVLHDENEKMRKAIEQLEQNAKQNAEVQNRRSIETGNLIDTLKQQVAAANAAADDFKRKFNSLCHDGNERAANFAKITAERDDVKAELKRTQVTLQKKQHEAQAMMDALDEKDRRIAALMQQLDEISKDAPATRGYDAAPAAAATMQDDPAMPAIDDIDWEDDGSQPPHPGEDPRQLSLF